MAEHKDVIGKLGEGGGGGGGRGSSELSWLGDYQHFCQWSISHPVIHENKWQTKENNFNIRVFCRQIPIISMMLSSTNLSLRVSPHKLLYRQTR